MSQLNETKKGWSPAGRRGVEGVELRPPATCEQIKAGRPEVTEPV